MELTPEVLCGLHCVNASATWVLDDEATCSLEFAADPSDALGGFGTAHTVQGHVFRVWQITANKTGEKVRRWSVEMKDETAWVNMTPYLGRPDWKDFGGGYHTSGDSAPMFARVGAVMAALGLPWDDENPLVPLPTLSGGESKGDIRSQVLKWVQRSVPPAGDAPAGAVLKYDPQSDAHAVGEIRTGFEVLPIGGLHTGVFVNGVEVRTAQRVNAAGLAAAINTMNAGVTATASGTRVNLTAATAGEAGTDITLAVAEEEGAVTTSGPNLTGGADAVIVTPARAAEIYLAVDSAEHWQEMGTPTSVWLEIASSWVGAYSTFDFDTMGRAATAAEYADKFNTYCTAQNYPYRAERVSDLIIRLFCTVAGAAGNYVICQLTNIRHPAERYGLGLTAGDIVYSADNTMQMAGGADAVEEPAVAATGWVDFGSTGNHPLVEHTGLFINGEEVQGHGLNAAALVQKLNAAASYGVTAALTPGAVQDGVVHLSARTAGAAGNNIAMEYTGDSGALTLSGPYLAGGTHGAVVQVAQLWGSGSRTENVSITPRYDLVIPCAGTYGRYHIRVPHGESLAQPGAFALYVPELELSGRDPQSDNGGGGGLPESYVDGVQDAAGQWMVVRGIKVPDGWSATGSGGQVNPGQATAFWSKFQQFRLLKSMASYLKFGPLSFYPVPAEDAYPPAEGGLAQDGEVDPPANYKELVSGNLYVLAQGSFPASSKARNNVGSLHFCRGELEQTVILDRWPQQLPEGVTREDLEKIFTDTYFENADPNSGKRAALFSLSAVFIDRSYKRFKTGTNADFVPDSGGGGGGTGGTGGGGTAADDPTEKDYGYALEEYYKQHSQLYHDVSATMVLAPGFDPAAVLGGQLVAETGQTAACPIREVSVDLLSRRVSVSAGSPALLSFDELLERRMLVKKRGMGMISRATGGSYNG